jgi:hypothetical protein
MPGVVPVPQHPELILSHSAPHPNTAGRELASQECGHACEHSETITSERPSQSPQDIGTEEQPGTGSFWFLSATQNWPPATALHIQIPPRENRSHRSTDTQACRTDKSETLRPANTRDNQMARGKDKNISNRNQGYLASSEPSSPATMSSGYLNTPEKQDSFLKSHFMMMIEDFKKDINNSLKEIQENTGKQVEALKEETQKSFKELEEGTTKQVKDMNQTIQDLKMEIETIKKSQKETTLGSLRKRWGVIDASITNRIQEIEERMSGAEDTIENIDTQSKKMQRAPNPKHLRNPGHNEKTKPKDNRYRREGRFPT